jgi:hypothetical protein
MVKNAHPIHFRFDLIQFNLKTLLHTQHRLILNTYLPKVALTRHQPCGVGCEWIGNQQTAQRPWNRPADRLTSFSSPKKIPVPPNPKPALKLQTSTPNTATMMRPTQLPLRTLSRAVSTPLSTRTIHITASKAANVAPVLGTGPPPEPPTPEVRNIHERVERRRKQAELLKQAKVIRNAKDGKTTTLRKRFWKEVTVQEVDGSFIYRKNMKAKWQKY